MNVSIAKDVLNVFALVGAMPVTGFLPNGLNSALISGPMKQTDFNSLIADIAANKDRQAFGLLFEHYGPRVKAFMIRRGMDAQSAEDIAQETMVRVWRKAPSFDADRAEAAAWIFSIARNLSIDVFRRKQRSGISIELPEDLEGEGRPDDDLLGTQSRARVAKALKSLPVEQLELVKLAFFEDKSHGEIASLLNIPLGTIKSRLRLAYGKLRGLLGDLK